MQRTVRRIRILRVTLVVACFLLLPSLALAQEPPPAEPPAEAPPPAPDRSTIHQYVETVPGSGGSAAAPVAKGKSQPLPKPVQRQIQREAGSDAELLERVATGAEFGAPQSTLPAPTQSAPPERAEPVAPPEPKRAEPSGAVEDPAREPLPAPAARPTGESERESVWVQASGDSGDSGLGGVNVFERRLAGLLALVGIISIASIVIRRRRLG